MQKIFLIVALIFIASSAGAQSEKIDDQTYPALLAKLQAGDTAIDYTTFRYSLLANKKYRQQANFLQTDSLEKVMYARARKDDYNGVVAAAKAILSINYTSMPAHKYLQQSYKYLGDSINHKRYKAMEFGLLRSILRSGNGKTCATAWEVISIEEEYFILDIQDAYLQSQSIVGDGSACDKMDVKEDGKDKTYYFGISRFLGLEFEKD